jgi:acetoin utilization deacetylase AcuC-like enzyme
MELPLGFFYHPSSVKHRAGTSHPEQPERLRTVLEALGKRDFWRQMQHYEPGAAREKELLLCHTLDHIAQVRTHCALSLPLDPDTGTCPDSWPAALHAVGAGLEAADEIAAGRLKRAFCLVRPPGHHAESDQSMGFCLFNSIAITARYLRQRHGFERVAIIDFDAHHGNGTQQIFYEDGSVLYASTHQYPFYPGTGSIREEGAGKGQGFIINCPLPAGTGMKGFNRAFTERIIPGLDKFKPEILLISAGFDAHRNDPITDLDLTSDDFGTITSWLADISSRVCGGRILSMLEGGYALDALSESVICHLKFLQRD